MLNVKIIRLDSIRLQGGTQSRAELDSDVIEAYSENLSRLPPIVVYHDGESYWLADGFHRVRAHQVAGREEVAAEVLQGTLRDAILYSCGANATHGLPRTREDKRRAVERLLRDEEWCKWSDREIARRCQVSHPFVASVRSNLTYFESGNVTGSEEVVRVYECDGKVLKATFRRDTSPVDDMDEEFESFISDAYSSPEAEATEGGASGVEVTSATETSGASGELLEIKPPAERTAEAAREEVTCKACQGTGRVTRFRKAG